MCIRWCTFVSAPQVAGKTYIMPIYSTEDNFKKLLTDALAEDFLEDVKTFIQESYFPNDIFTEDELEEWALENGFKKED